MRLVELFNDKRLNESMNFHVGRLRDVDGRQHFSGSDFEKETVKPCWVCDGTGVEKNGEHEYPCEMCHGKKILKDYESTGPSLDVANTNGFEIQKMLGIDDPDYAGILHNKDLPDAMRKLIKLKNAGSAGHTQDIEKSQSPMKKYTDDNGMTRIGRGPTMYDMGRSQPQVDHYIDTLIAMIKFAQENNAEIGWA